MTTYFSVKTFISLLVLVVKCLSVRPSVSHKKGGNFRGDSLVLGHFLTVPSLTLSLASAEVAYVRLYYISTLK